jgi:heme-degrading monooxygenase HmoA
MISRQWCGLAKPTHAERYLDYLREGTFPALRAIPGFVDASVLRREVDQGVEFLVVTRWTSLLAIEQFAGADSERAVVPEKVQEMMIDYDRSVRHYEVVE